MRSREICSGGEIRIFGVLHLIVSLGIILALDKILKKAFVAASIKFPSALFGMFCIFSILIILDSTVPVVATGLMNFCQPALVFIQRWLPLFYVPTLVVLPLSVRDIPAAAGIKIGFIIAGGWLATGFIAIAIRKMLSPFSTIELWSWSGIKLISFVGAFVYPMVLGTSAQTCLPFLLASTVLGYIVGTELPSYIKKVFHPIICCALLANLATAVSSIPGAGVVLMGFFGSVILSFVFPMFKQRKNVIAINFFRRHSRHKLSSVITRGDAQLNMRLKLLNPNLTKLNYFILYLSIRKDESSVTCHRAFVTELCLVPSIAVQLHV
ncbi:hypothetical protein UlMin_008862 [Ulmus minor]